MKKIIYALMVFSVLGTSHRMFAQQKEKPTFVTQAEEIKEYRLSNGLQVLLIPDASQNNLLVNIVYKVGSKHEGYGEKGMAHLLEHMLFKSTTNLGDIKKMLSDKGGNANGTTWYDRTNYFEIFPSSDENLQWALEMEADRMVNATILQEDLEKEFSVVRNEFEIGENSPLGVLMEKTVNTAYMWHNYGLSTIGSKEDIERVKAPQLRLFYEKYYRPDNAVLVLAGKFDEAKALQYIEDYFSVLPKPAQPLNTIYTVEPAQDGERFVEVKRAGDTQHIGVFYHGASYADKDFAALKALSEILTSDPSGYLYKALVETHKASSLWSSSPTVRDAGYIYFNLDLPKEKEMATILADVKAEFDKIPSIAYTAEDVERAKATILKNIEATKNNTIGFAVSLTESIGAGDYRLYLLYRDNIEQLTVEDIQRVAQKYFRTNNRTIGTFIPSKDEQRVKPAEFMDHDILQLVENYKGKEVSDDTRPFEASISNLENHYKHGQISNGLKYGVIDKDIKGKKIQISVTLPVSNEKALAGKGYIGSFTAQMLKAGTQNRTKQEIKDKLDQLKSYANFSFSGQTLRISILTYQEHFEETMKVVEDIVTHPVFPESELDKIRNEYTTYLEGMLNDPQSVAFTEIARMTSQYPKNSIHYTPSIQEIIDGFKKVSRQEMVDFYNEILGANNGVVSVIGIGDDQRVRDVLETTFGKWNSKSTYEKAYPTYFATKKDSKIIETPDKENAAAIGQLNFQMDRQHPDYPALVFANEILGGGGFLTARIPQRLREKDGISYGAGSMLNIPNDPNDKVSTFSIYAFLNPTKRGEVAQAIQEEIQKIIADGVTEEEMTNHKLSWKNARQTNLGSDNYLLSLSNSFLTYQTPFSDFDKLNREIENLSAKEVNQAIQKYIKPSQITSIYVGDFSKK